MSYVLQTGPNHPGVTMWVQESDGRSACDMTHVIERAATFSTKEQAMQYRQKFSRLYCLRIVSAKKRAST